MVTHYLYVGDKKQNIFDGTTQVNVVMCIECGKIIEQYTDDTYACQCKKYVQIDGKGNIRGG